MKQFESEKEMLEELDHFIYKAKSLQSSPLRESLMVRINEFLKSNKLDGDQHNFVDSRRAEGRTYFQQEVNEFIIRTMADVTNKMLEKFKGYRSPEEIAELINKYANECVVTFAEDTNKWIDENV